MRDAGKSRRFELELRPLFSASALLLLTAALSSCDKSPVSDQEAAPQVSTAALLPLPATSTQRRPVESHQFAPPGVFFLLSPVSVTTDDGITGLRPGTRLIQRADGRFTAEGLTLELRSDQITRDLQVAARIAGADQAAQAAIRQALQANNPPSIATGPTPTPAIAQQGRQLQTLTTDAIAARVNPLEAGAQRVNPDYDSSGNPRNHSRIH